jgi:hypothetical protein
MKQRVKYGFYLFMLNKAWHVIPYVLDITIQIADLRILS